MNHNISFMLVTAVLGSMAVTACNREPVPSGDKPGGKRVRVSVSVEIPPLEDDETKTTFSGRTLVWNGDETMDVLIGNYDKGTTHQTELLHNNGSNVFEGEFTLDTENFTESDMCAVTVPGGKGSKSVKNGTNFIAQMFISEDQVQESDGVMNGEYFPLYAILDDAMRTACKTGDGSYKFEGIQLKWGCGVLRFNIYGTHPSMDAGEILKSVKVYSGYGVGQSSMVVISTNNTLYNGKNKIQKVTLTNGTTIAGKTAENGAVVYMAIAARCPNTEIDKIEIETDKAIYIKDINSSNARWTNGTNHRGKVYQYRLNISTFKRMDLEVYNNYATKLASIVKRSGLPSVQVCMTKGDDIITIESVNDSFYATAPHQEEYPLNTMSLYQACSMSKPPLANIAMKLVDEGKLELGKPVYEYYPEMLDLFADDASKEHAKEITAYDILVHVTGLDNSTYSNITYGGVTGTYKYSGPAVHILDLAIGKILGKDLSEYSKDYIFDQLGMKHSNYFWQSEYDYLAAYGYRTSGSYGRSSGWTSSNAAYTLRTTAEEYTKYIRWTMHGAGLSTSSYEQLLHDYFATSSATSQALIWRHDTHSELQDIYHHRGNNGNFKGWMCFVPSQDMSLIFLTNGESSFNFYQEIAKLFLGTNVNIAALNGLGGALPDEEDDTPGSKIKDPDRNEATTW